MITQILPHNWTIPHGFYALMGGFVFDTQESFPAEPNPFATGIDRVSVTPKGIKLLASCGHLPSLSGEEIADKSKIDELGKVFACIQATWLVVQICTRLGLHLPVTLLEVSTASHVLCALVIYGLWWHKPRKVSEPTILRGAWTGPLAAFMMMSSQVGQDQMLPGFRMEGDSCEISQLKFYAERVDEVSDLEEPCDRIDKPQERKHIRHFRIRAKSGLPQLEQTNNDHELIEEGEDLQSQLTRTRWQLACKAVEQYPAVRQMLRHPVTDLDRRYHVALAAYPEMPEKFRKASHEEKASGSPDSWWECGSQHLVVAVASNWPHDGLLRTTGGLVVGATLWIASIGFTAVHIAAWHADFPSGVEAWFWRSSALYIAFSGLLWASLHVLAETWAKLWWAWYDIMSGNASRLMMVLVTIVCSICGCAYLVARMFLIIEAFICLRSLTIASYVVPSWTLGVPHVG